MRAVVRVESNPFMDSERAFKFSAKFQLDDTLRSRVAYLLLMKRGWAFNLQPVLAKILRGSGQGGGFFS